MLLRNQPDLTPDLESHFKTLGVGSVSAYKLWCYRHGLSTDLNKSSEQRQTEIALLTNKTPSRDPDVHKRHDPQRAKYLARIFRGELQTEKLSSVLHIIRESYNTFGDDKNAQQAFGRLVLHAEKYSDLLWHQHAIGRYGNTRSNTYLSALEQLAHHHKNWLRPVEDWRPEHNKPRNQFRTLVRYLLAKYDVPQFFDCAFFQGNTEEAHRQQYWFKHVGNGLNIRTVGVPMHITKRMAHLVMQHKGYHHTIYQALRKVQYEAFGGNWLMAWELSHGPLGDTFENEDFWETVVHFLANQTFLEHSYINPIVDYIRNQKFTPQRIPQPDGTEQEGPPPHPNFCMKGRSIQKLIREVDIWHQELTGMEDVAFVSWPASPFKTFETVVFDSKLKRNIQWTIHELVTSQQLYAEGRMMHHCAGSYAKRCVSGERSIWSLRALDLDADEENQVQEHVLTIEVDNQKRAVVQHAGKFNLKPFGKKHLTKEKKTGNLYLYLLHQAPTFMRMWMDREGLSHV